MAVVLNGKAAAACAGLLLLSRLARIFVFVYFKAWDCFEFSSGRCNDVLFTFPDSPYKGMLTCLMINHSFRLYPNCTSVTIYWHHCGLLIFPCRHATTSSTSFRSTLYIKAPRAKQSVNPFGVLSQYLRLSYSNVSLIR